MVIKDNLVKMLSEDEDNTVLLRKIDQQFKEQISEQTTEEERRAYFFGMSDNLKPQKPYLELLEVWDILEPNVWMWKKGMLDGYWIIKVLREMNSIWQVFQLNNEIEKRERKQLIGFRKLLEQIEDYREKTFLVTVSGYEAKPEVDTIYSLRYFDEGNFHPYRDYIIRGIIAEAGNSPVFVIGENNRKQEISGRAYYINRDLNWKEIDIRSVNLDYTAVDRNFLARRRGSMKGYTLDDL